MLDLLNEVFDWYIKTQRTEVNSVRGHSQIMQLECPRSGTLGD